MSRDGSGIYNLPDEYPFSPNTIIASGEVNTILADLGAAMTGSLPRDGQAGMTGAFKLADGTAGTPAFSFNSEASTGIFRPGTNLLGFSVAGSERMRFSTTGNLLLGLTSDGGQKLQVSGTAAITGNTTIGGTLGVTGASTLTGNVGIGIAPTTGALLEVNGGVQLRSTNKLSFTDTLNQTYVYASAINTLVLGTSSQDRVTINSGGAVTIGVPASGTGLTVNGISGNNAAIFNTSGGATVGVRLDATSGYVGTNTNHPLGLYTNAATRMTIGTAGVVCINATTTAARLNQKLIIGSDSNSYGGMGLHTYSATDAVSSTLDFVKSGSNTVGAGAALASGSALGYLAWRGYTDTNVANIKDGVYILATTTAAWTGSSSPAKLGIFTTPSGAVDPVERVSITSDGALLVGTTSATIGDDTSAWFGAGGSALSNQTVIHLPNNATATWIALGFYRGSSQIGSIQYNGSGTSYVTTSDARLKGNIVDAASPGAKIDAMQVREFDFNGGGHVEHGFIAQELNEVAPEAVNIGGDDVNTNPWGVDYSKLVPMLVKEIQELRARVAALEQ